MHKPESKIGKYNYFIKTAFAFILVCLLSVNNFAQQHRGAPVKKDRLLKALKSKQLPTEDIVTIINRNGVDFQLTDEVKRSLVSAGARPEVINAVAQNLRSESLAKTKRRNKISETNYDELLVQAINSYKEQKNPESAVKFLESAVKLNPNDPKAFQMLGYINLYGLKNLSKAEKYMREAIENGGSAVFRVFHDDNGNFMRRCSGSLYISPERIRFESDDNVHTFETSTVNVEKIKLDEESSKIWKDHTIFKVFLKIGKTEAKFRFAPITANEEESKMAARMVIESQLSRKPAGTAMNFNY